MGSIDVSLVDFKDGAQLGFVGSDRLELDLLNSTSTVLSCDQLIIQKIQMMWQLLNIIWFYGEGFL